MKKAKRHWRWVEKKRCLWKMCIVLNYRFSAFRPFTHDIITQNITHSNICIFIAAILQVQHLTMGRSRQRKQQKYRQESMQSKKWYLSHKFFYVFFSVTQSFLLGFSWSCDSITGSNKKSTSRNVPTSASETTIKYLHKNIKISLLWQCGLFINAIQLF